MVNGKWVSCPWLGTDNVCWNWRLPNGKLFQVGVNRKTGQQHPKSDKELAGWAHSVYLGRVRGEPIGKLLNMLGE